MCQVTENLDSRYVSAKLNAATNGNDLADALMAGAAIIGGSKGNTTIAVGGKSPVVGGVNPSQRLPNNGVDYEHISTAGLGKSATPRDLNCKLFLKAP